MLILLWIERMNIWFTSKEHFVTIMTILAWWMWEDEMRPPGRTKFDNSSKSFSCSTSHFNMNDSKSDTYWFGGEFVGIKLPLSNRMFWICIKLFHNYVAWIANANYQDLFISCSYCFQKRAIFLSVNYSLLDDSPNRQYMW